MNYNNDNNEYSLETAYYRIFCQLVLQKFGKYFISSIFEVKLMPITI